MTGHGALAGPNLLTLAVVDALVRLNASGGRTGVVDKALSIWRIQQVLADRLGGLIKGQ